MNSLHRQAKALSFWYLEARFTAELGTLSPAASKKLVANLEPASKDRSLLIDGLKATQQAVSPVGGLDEMIRLAADTTKMRLDSLANVENERLAVNLWGWIQHEITVATTESVYGPADLAW
jgi:hypothetical protein